MLETLPPPEFRHLTTLFHPWDPWAKFSSPGFPDSPTPLSFSPAALLNKDLLGDVCLLKNLWLLAVNNWIYSKHFSPAIIKAPRGFGLCFLHHLSLLSWTHVILPDRPSASGICKHLQIFFHAKCPPCYPSQPSSRAALNLFLFDGNHFFLSWPGLAFVGRGLVALITKRARYSRSRTKHMLQSLREESQFIHLLVMSHVLQLWCEHSRHCRQLGVRQRRANRLPRELPGASPRPATTISSFFCKMGNKYLFMELL